MAFSGYVFENASAITPYLEEPRLGPTSQFCSEIAKRLGCYVLAGYPERLSAEEDKPPLEALVRTESASGLAVGANSAVLYDPEGSWAGGYRKTNLYDTDKTWAKAGIGFATYHLPSPLRTKTDPMSWQAIAWKTSQMFSFCSIIGSIRQNLRQKATMVGMIGTPLSIGPQDSGHSGRKTH
ncbi:hypothetical protein EST38_g1767 [Candolleomyces aberdarensis]|uniref:CN hydrolase domain-containing protein n=1 Tax=Candolleomyces aberdarensis TaxID=2316362 RepID=A0A4Q2DWP6_9AGAR|nr:hypothetical protein EST38_g1767 [Candolleomyces aberdarensis]